MSVKSVKPVKLELTLQEWIEQEGLYTVAKALKVTDSAVRHWRRGWILPQHSVMEQIRKLSRGTVSFDRTLEAHFSATNKKNRYKSA